MILDDFLDRDGALLDSALETYAAGDLADEELQAIAAHLRDHAADRGRLDALMHHQGAFVVPPLRPPRRRRIPPWASLASAAVVLAAGLLLAIRPGFAPDDSEWRRKGREGTLVLEAWAERAAGGVALHNGDVVSAGERVGFRAAGDAGYLIVVGIDDTHHAYPAFAADGSAVELPARPEPMDLVAAVRFDDQPGLERLVAVQCRRPFGLDTFATTLSSAHRTTPPDRDLPPLRAGCEQTEIRLHKAAP